MQIARLSRFDVNEKRCIGFALVLVPWPRQADSAENPIVKTKLRGLALLRIFWSPKSSRSTKQRVNGPKRRGQTVKAQSDAGLAEVARHFALAFEVQLLD
jgi:hypothetical protein